MSAHLIEIKSGLGNTFEAEPWDRGWAKAYETISLESFNADYVEQVAARMAQVIGVLEPIRRDLGQESLRKSQGGIPMPPTDAGIGMPALQIG